MTQVVHSSIAARSPAPSETAFSEIIRRPVPVAAKPGEHEFVAVRDSPDFTALRRRFRRVAFLTSALFFLWYLTYVLLSAYAPDFMGHRFVGSVNVGLALGVAQFASTIAITFGYARFARNRIDPQIADIRTRAGVGA